MASDDMHEDPSIYALDTETDERESALLLDPPGWYVTDPTTARFVRETLPTGRERWMIAALGELPDGKKTRLRVYMSPEKSPDGVADWSYKMYNDPKVGLRAVYKATIGESPSSSKHVEDFVTNYPIRMRLTRTGVDRSGNPIPGKEPDTMVVAFGRAVRV